MTTATRLHPDLERARDEHEDTRAATSPSPTP
jgi:hypothetical protein